MKTPIIFRYWSLLFLILFIAGCAPSLKLWEQATDNFNQGVTMETSTRLTQRMQVTSGETPPPEALPDAEALFDGSGGAAGTSPEDYYQKADDQISKALDAPTPLQKEGKLANARCLKALIAWKTGDAEVARANAALALQEFSKHEQSNSPRDEALARAIPGLVALDEIYETTQPMILQLKEQSRDAGDLSATDAKTLFTEGRDMYEDMITSSGLNSLASAKADFQAAIMKAPDHRQIATYLLLCEMAGLKNWYDLRFQLDNFSKRSGLKADDAEIKEWLDAEEERYLEEKNEGLEKLKEALEGGTSHPAYQYWNRVL